MRGRQHRADAGTSAADGTPAFVYAPELGDVGAELTLSDAESHYVARVCRVGDGERVTASDGLGQIATLRVLSRAGAVRVLIESVERHPRTRRGWLLSGAPEGSRDDWEVEKLAELGVERFVPIECERGAWTGASRRHERWERLAISAMKQSRSAHRLEVAPPAPLGHVLEHLPPGATRALASERGEPVTGAPPPAFWIGAVGPAAGLTAAEETTLTTAGFRAVRLGSRRLRTETAALALAALLGLPEVSGAPDRVS